MGGRLLFTKQLLYSNVLKSLFNDNQMFVCHHFYETSKICRSWTALGETMGRKAPSFQRRIKPEVELLKYPLPPLAWSSNEQTLGYHINYSNSQLEELLRTLNKITRLEKTSIELILDRSQRSHLLLPLFSQNRAD